MVLQFPSTGDVPLIDTGGLPAVVVLWSVFFLCGQSIAYVISHFFKAPAAAGIFVFFVFFVFGIVGLVTTQVGTALEAQWTDAVREGFYAIPLFSVGYGTLQVSTATSPNGCPIYHLIVIIFLIFYSFYCSYGWVSS